MHEPGTGRRRGSPRVAGRLAGALAVVAVGLIPAAGTALAHAELIDTSPADGEVLAASPATITLNFTEPVQVLADTVELLDDTGDTIDLPAPRADGSAVVVDVPALDSGGYVVSWRVVSVDGHPIAGAFTFAVGDATPPAASGVTVDAERSDASRLLPSVRAFLYGGLAIALGGGAFVLLAWPGGRRDPVLLRLVALGATVAMVAAVVRLPIEAAVLGIGLTDTYDLRSGKAWWALVVLTAGALGSVALLRSRADRRVVAAAVAALTVATGIAIAVAGHGGSGDATAAGIAATVVHLGAASVWVGGLVGLLRALTAADHGEAAPVARRFSNLALVAVALLASTGAIQAIRQLDDLDALTGSQYGRAVLIKLAVVAVLLLVALASRRLLASRSATSGPRLQRTVAAEVVLAAWVVAATGWLAGATPIPDEDGAYSATAEVDGVTAAISVDPASVGPNEIDVVVTAASGVPDEIEVRLQSLDLQTGAIAVRTEALGPGHVRAPVATIGFPGRWQITVDARFGEFDQTTLTAVVDVDG